MNKLQSIFCISTVLMFTLLLFFCVEDCSAQGRLGQARKSVSKKEKEEEKESKPKKKSTPAPKKKPFFSGSLSKAAPAASSNPPRSRVAAVSSSVRKNQVQPVQHQDSGHSSHDEHHNHRPRNPRPGPYFHFGASSCYEPPVIIQDVHVYEAPQASYLPPSVIHDLPPVANGQAYPIYNEPVDGYQYGQPVPGPDGQLYPPVTEPSVSQSPEIVFADESYRDWNAKLSAFYGSDFDDLSVTGLEFLVVGPGTLGLELGVNYLLEDAVGFRDHLWLGDANIVYEALHGGPLRGRIGIGTSWLGDSIGVEFGLNLTAGFDLHLNERWALTGQADIGSLGDADYSHLRLDIGRRFQAAEWIVGYDRYEIDGIDLGNWITGLRMRY